MKILKALIQEEDTSENNGSSILKQNYNNLKGKAQNKNMKY